jgi:hypothetical protein
MEIGYDECLELMLTQPDYVCLPIKYKKGLQL